MLERPTNLLRVVILNFMAAAWLSSPQLLDDQATASTHPGAGQIDKPVASTSATKDALGSHRFPQNTTTTILYDQTDNTGFVSSASQDFGPSEPFNSEAADDFIVPPGRTWTIQQLNVLGVYDRRFGFGRADSVNVAIYSDSSGIPGFIVCIYPGLVPIDTAGDFDIMLPAPCTLNSGHYWVEVQSHIRFNQGRWFWTERAVKSNSESVWRNPGRGFGTLCTTFMPRLSTCGVGRDPDLSFQIIGADASAFDLCIQDDSSGTILRINSTTGEYEYTNCSGFTLGGAGGLIKRGSTIIILQQYAGDRRVFAKIDVGVNRATAYIQAQGMTFTITDRNIADDTCACTAH
jgi:hypothetical protein